MTHTKNTKLTAGFTVVEVLLIIVIVAVVGGTGYYVVSQRSKTTSSNSSTEKTTTSKVGTIGDVESKANSDLASEQKAEDDAANQEATAATTEANAIDNVGGGYETNF